MPRGSSAPRRYPSRAVIEAVLFDWTNTLVQFTWDDELLVAGHRAGLGRDDPEFTERYRELMLGRRAAAPVRRGAARAGRRRPRRVHRRRARGLAPGACRPRLGPGAARARCGRAGSRRASSRTPGPSPPACSARTRRPSGSRRCSTCMVFSEEVGRRQAGAGDLPARAGGARASSRSAAMFVGDRLETDVQGAANVGMTTVQALWFCSRRQHRFDRAGLPGVHADGRAERRAPRSAVRLKSQVLRPSVNARTMQP